MRVSSFLYEVISAWIKLLLRILKLCAQQKKFNFPLFTMTQCNTATLAVEPFSVLQIALSFFDLHDISDKIMFLQESSIIKMSNRLNEHSSLLIARKWKLPCSYISSHSVTTNFVYNFKHKLFPRIHAPIILHRHITKIDCEIKSNHAPTFEEFVENLLTKSFLEASSTRIKHSLFTSLPLALNLTFTSF